MKLAFVDSLPVGGGLSRFSLLLCKSLIENYPSLTVDYFVHHGNLNHIPEIKNTDPRINVRVLQASCPPTLPEKIIKKISLKFRSAQSVDNGITEEIEKKVNRSYDLAYFPSAHMMKRPSLSIPIVGTLHDFNWKYFFGRQIFSRAFVEMMDEEILNWMNRGLMICSSQDVVDEAKKLYPAAGRFPEVIHIAPVVVQAEMTEEKASHILQQLNIDFPYIIFPGNFYPHKNHLNLFTAFALLKQRPGFEQFKLVLTGINSEQVQKGIAETRGLRLLTKNSNSKEYDVIGMGYQSNEAIEALIVKAKLLVSPSIYEAICTPGMDAWNFGIPTAISDIPPFREHESVWGIRSAFFDPMNPENIADVLESYLKNYEQAVADGKLSQKNMALYTWKNVADRYMEIFVKATRAA